MKSEGEEGEGRGENVGNRKIVTVGGDEEDKKKCLTHTHTHKHTKKPFKISICFAISRRQQLKNGDKTCELEQEKQSFSKKIT